MPKVYCCGERAKGLVCLKCGKDFESGKKSPEKTRKELVEALNIYAEFIM